MQATLNPYLTFNGNCREAMEFYRDCIGGELHFQTIEASPLSGQMPDSMKKQIVHASLRGSGHLLMASDMVGKKGLQKGNAVSLLLDCSSEESIKTCYAKLSAGGEASHPLHRSFWGALFGDLVDKYGNQWLLHFDSRPDRKEK